MSGTESIDSSSLLNKPVESIVKTDIVIFESDKLVDEAIKTLQSKSCRSVLISHDREIIGIVTKSDILFKVMSKGRNPTKIKLREIMTTPIIAVKPNTSIQDAINIMNKNNIRQIIISSNSNVIGILSRETIYDKIHLINTNITTNMISGGPVCIINPKSIALTKSHEDTHILSCPYCSSPYDTKESLSKHIDRLHLGSGALEGDSRRLYE
jgi:CBS domain-containing protein